MVPNTREDGVHNMKSLRQTLLYIRVVVVIVVVFDKLLSERIGGRVSAICVRCAPPYCWRVVFAAGALLRSVPKTRQVCVPANVGENNLEPYSGRAAGIPRFGVYFVCTWTSRWVERSSGAALSVV